MEKKQKLFCDRLFCDRIEEGIAVLLDEQAEGTKVYEIPAENLPCPEEAEGKYFLCTVKDGVIVSAEIAENKTIGRNKKRLSALFKKTKNSK